MEDPLLREFDWGWILKAKKFTFWRPLRGDLSAVTKPPPAPGGFLLLGEVGESQNGKMTAKQKKKVKPKESGLSQQY